MLLDKQTHVMCLLGKQESDYKAWGWQQKNVNHNQLGIGQTSQL